MPLRLLLSMDEPEESLPECTCALIPIAPMPGMSPFGLVSSAYLEARLMTVSCPRHQGGAKPGLATGKLDES